jgi:hypothetical protein
MQACRWQAIGTQQAGRLPLLTKTVGCIRASNVMNEQLGRWLSTPVLKIPGIGCLLRLGASQQVQDLLMLGMSRKGLLLHINLLKDFVRGWPMTKPLRLPQWLDVSMLKVQTCRPWMAMMGIFCEEAPLLKRPVWALPPCCHTCPDAVRPLCCALPALSTAGQATADFRAVHLSALPGNNAVCGVAFQGCDPRNVRDCCKSAGVVQGSFAFVKAEGVQPKK